MNPPVASENDDMSQQGLWAIRHACFYMVTGTFIPRYFYRWNFRFLVLLFPETFVPWNFHSPEREWGETFTTHSELTS